MKKQAKKKLVLAKETLKRLESGKLQEVQGGLMPAPSMTRLVC